MFSKMVNIQFRRKLVLVGNSLFLSIPPIMLDILNAEKGDELTISYRNKKVVISKND